MEDIENVSEKIVEVAKENMTRWLETLKTKDSQRVAELYSKDATFLPTVSGDFKRGQKGAEEYFAHFLAKNPEGKVIDEVITPLGDSVYLHCGMYNFELDGEGGRSTVKARFDYVWKRNIDNKWEIVHHHSSLRPE